VTGEGSFLWIIAILILLISAWLIWRRWWASNNLDLRLKNCDMTLLNSDQMRINEVIQAPYGSTVVNVAQIQVNHGIQISSLPVPNMQMMMPSRVQHQVVMEEVKKTNLQHQEHQIKQQQ